MSIESGQEENIFQGAGADDTAMRQDAASFDPDNPKQVLALTGKIFVRHIPQCILWAFCYLMVIDAFGFTSKTTLENASFAGHDLLWLYYGLYLLVPLLLLFLFGWLHRLTVGKVTVSCVAAGPFRWVRFRSLKWFLLICLGVAAAYICRDVILSALSALLWPVLAPRWLYNDTSLSMLDIMIIIRSYNFDDLRAIYPFLAFPVFFMLQWASDYLCIRAARGKWEDTAGSFDTRGLAKRMFRVELRLMPLYLVAPLLLYWAASNFASAVLGEASAQTARTVTQVLSIVLFFVYTVRSAMARTLLYNALPNAQWAPAPPMDFSKIDAAHARAMEEKRREENGEEPLPPEEDGEKSAPEKGAEA